MVFSHAWNRGMEAMESGPGVPDAEAPVDHGLCVVSLLFQRVDLPAEFVSEVFSRTHVVIRLA